MNKKSLAIGLLLILSTIIYFNINPVSAEIPAVDNILPWTSGSNTILNITVSHDFSGLGGLDWVERVVVEIDGVDHSVNTADASFQKKVFTMQYNMGEVAGIPTVRALPYCSNSGQGDWSGPVTVPEFSLFLLVPFFIVGSIAVLLIKSKITAKVPK